jgi:hypothetical protein
VARLGNFYSIWLLLEVHQDFSKSCSSLKKWQYFGLLWAKSNILNFHQNSWNLKWSFGVDILIRTIFGYFLKNWLFFSKLLVTLARLMQIAD